MQRKSHEFAEQGVSSVAEWPLVKTREFVSPIGSLKLSATHQGLIGCQWLFETSENSPSDVSEAWRRGQLDMVGVQQASENPALIDEVLDTAILQLQEYFVGERTKFTLPLVQSGPQFTVSVWRALMDIPYGTTKSYRDIAMSVGNGQAVRAVGQANRRNPLAVIVPCHRVIGQNGKLVGYSGSHVNLKESLLQFERDVVGTE